jgi:hypothetical protein
MNMQNETFERALKSIAHPISLVAIATVLINDHILRQIAPSWLTGKLSDFTWLIFAPFLLAAMLAWLIPQHLNRRTEITGWISIVLTGLIFGLAKTIPFFHSIAVQVLETFNGWPNNLLIDPTDLLTLPALLISIKIWRTADRSFIPARAWPLLVLAILMTTGTTPPYFPSGVREIAEENGLLFTLDFHSDDGGLTWQPGGKPDLYSMNYRPKLEVFDPANSQIVYRFNPGLSIERSDDAGLTWHLDFNLSGEQARVNSIRPGVGSTEFGPFGGVMHEPTGNLVVGMGPEGVLVRLAGGEWRWVQVGDFAVPQMNQIDRIISMLSGELFLESVFKLAIDLTKVG